MNGTAIFFPVLTHIFLILAMYVLLAVRKAKAINSGLVDVRETALNSKAWTPDVVLVSNNIANQFETPVLFYVLCSIIYVSGFADLLSIFIAWSYVILRYAHAYIHVTSNFVPYRMRVFALSIVLILVLLVRTAILLAGS